MQSCLYYFDVLLRCCKFGTLLSCSNTIHTLSLLCLRLAQIWRRELLLKTKDNIQTHITLGNQGRFLSGIHYLLIFCVQYRKNYEYEHKKP